MSTSVRENILANVKTTLEGINGVDPYNTTVRRVTRSIMAVTDEVVTPTIFFTATDTAGPPLEGGGSSSGITVWTMRVDVVGVVERGFGPSETAAHNLLHDILYAMGQDRQRGNYARNTTPVALSTETQEGAGEPWAIVRVSFEILYRHDYNAPATQR